MIHQAGRISYKSAPAATHIFKVYLPSLVFFGAATGIAAVTMTERVPLIRETFLQKIPFIGDHWVRKVDPQDTFY